MHQRIIVSSLTRDPTTHPAKLSKMRFIRCFIMFLVLPGPGVINSLCWSWPWSKEIEPGWRPLGDIISWTGEPRSAWGLSVPSYPHLASLYFLSFENVWNSSDVCLFFIFFWEIKFKWIKNTCIGFSSEGHSHFKMERKIHGTQTRWIFKYGSGVGIFGKSLKQWGVPSPASPHSCGEAGHLWDEQALLCGRLWSQRYEFMVHQCIVEVIKISGLDKPLTWSL